MKSSLHWPVGIFVALSLLLSACGESERAEMPLPQEPTAEAIGYFCNMIVVDHPGPKGQIFLGAPDTPLWFSSVRDAIAFTLLPEESKNIAAIYVNDMARAQSWETPAPGTWIEAREAVYVIGSRQRGGMGAEEAVPFGTESDAIAFAEENGGRIVTLSEIPAPYILGGEDGLGGENGLGGEDGSDISDMDH